jgi:hypothetical protein
VDVGRDDVQFQHGTAVLMRAQLQTRVGNRVFGGDEREERLKLSGSDRSNGSGVLCLGGRNYRSPTDAPAGESPAA